MLGVVSFSNKACLVVGTKPDLSNLITHTLRQIGFVNVTKADGTEHGFLLLTKSNIDLVLLLDTATDEAVEMLLRIRQHNLPTIASVPIICVATAWSGDQITALRDAGASVLASLPLTMRTLLKHATRALNPREFVNALSYRGPCRRSSAHPNYTGPLRRSTDTTDCKPPRPQEPPPQAHTQVPLAAAPSARPAMPPPRAPTAQPDEQEAITTPELRQTKIVVDNSYETAMEVDDLSSRLRDADGPHQRAKLCRDIASASERMINLMSLADQRVREFGCSDSLVGRLESIRTTIVRNAEGLAESGARQVVAYGGRVVSGQMGIPLGVGVALAHQMSRIDAIINVLGGTNVMSPECRTAVLEAREVANAVAALEAKSSVMIPDLDLRRAPRNPQGGR